MNPKFSRALLSCFISIFIIFLLNTRFFNKPALGKLFDPFNGFWQNAEKKPIKLPKYDFKVEGCRENIEIKFDKNLIPHVKTNNEYDAYFAQGYLSAFHRLWKMEFTTLSAEGRLSEIFGYNESILGYDQIQRNKGLKLAARNTLKALMNNPKTYEYIKSYTDGVNAYINSLSYKQLPIEYKLLGYKPTLWTPLKTALVIVSFTDYLSGQDAALENTNALKKLGRKQFDFLYPDFPDGIRPIVPNIRWNIKPLNITSHKVYVPEEVPNIKLPNKQYPDARGSNCWAISKNKTKNGNTYFANDVHLGLKLPSLMYLMHIHSPEMNLVGALIPGMPTFGVGFNQYGSWGVTNSLINTRDWYLIEFEDDSMREYKYDGKLLKAQHIVEEIKIRGGASVFETIIYTHLGPVFINKNKVKNGKILGLAMKWIGHDIGNIVLAFDKINKSKNHSDFQDGVNTLKSPGLNLGYASVSGDVAMHVAGSYPARWKEQGKFILDGTNPKHEWQGFIPAKHNPYILNPKEGYVLSANEHPTYNNYPYYHYGPFYRYFRNHTINSGINKLSKFNVKEMMNLQLNTYSLPASKLLPIILSYIDKNNLNKFQLDAYNILLSWDYKTDSEKIAPSIFRAWQMEIRRRLWKFIEEKNMNITWPTFYNTINIITKYPKSKYLNFGGDENMNNLINSSFLAALKSLETWKVENKKEFTWGNYRKIPLNHIIPQLTSFGKGNIEVGGSRYTINSNEKGAGACLRLVSELSKDKVSGWLIYPGGQPGNPGNPYYTQFLEKWRTGKYIKISLDINESDRNEYPYSFKLIPKKK